MLKLRDRITGLVENCGAVGHRVNITRVNFTHDEFQVAEMDTAFEEEVSHFRNLNTGGIGMH
jgi:hypothetical protein